MGWLCWLYEPLQSSFKRKSTKFNLFILLFSFWLKLDVFGLSRSPSKPLARKLVGGTDWESVSRNSLSDERLETQSLPTRSPPGTPNQWVRVSGCIPDWVSLQLLFRQLWQWKCQFNHIQHVYGLFFPFTESLYSNSYLLFFFGKKNWKNKNSVFAVVLILVSLLCRFL